MKKTLCPCHSGKPNSECCEPLHLGTHRAQNAVELMRSRYSAYARLLTAYIISTTDPDQQSSLDKASILRFGKETHFEGLVIKSFEDFGDTAYVTFHARLTQAGRDTSYTERSFFKKINGFWYYLKGEG